jgi:hypothetical protein
MLAVIAYRFGFLEVALRRDVDIRILFCVFAFPLKGTVAAGTDNFFCHCSLLGRSRFHTHSAKKSYPKCCVVGQIA